MKLCIAVILIFFSFVIAYIRSSEIKRNKNDSKIIFKLSEKIKNNFSAEMLPVFKLSEDFFAAETGETATFSSTDDLIKFINTKYSALPFIKMFTDYLSALPYLPMDELASCFDKLIKIAEKGVNDCEDKYTKEGKNAFILYPGIVTVLILILI